MSIKRTTVSGGVRMKSTENQMTGEARFDGCFCRLHVPHFTDHDHIRVGTQEGSKDFMKGQPDFRMHLDLPKPCLGNFNGILYGPYLHFRSIEILHAFGVIMIQQSIEKWNVCSLPFLANLTPDLIFSGLEGAGQIRLLFVHPLTLK